MPKRKNRIADIAPSDRGEEPVEISHERICEAGSPVLQDGEEVTDGSGGLEESMGGWGSSPKGGADVQSDLPRVTVTIARFSGQYKALAEEQFKAGLVKEKGWILVDDQVLVPGRVYDLPCTDTVKTLIRMAALMMLRHPVHQKTR